MSNERAATRPTKPSSGGATCVTARCEGCGLSYEIDDLAASDADLVFRCDDCGSPVYVVGPDLVALIDGCGACVAVGGECDFHAGFGVGWDACAALMAGWVEAKRSAELVGIDSSTIGVDGGVS